MNDKPMVSVIIPTYNYGQYVTEAVESVLGQTYANREIIVVDDGSTDDTRERLGSYGDRVRYIYQENRGLSAARNTGIKAARGDLIAFLDADDVWVPEKLSVEVPILGAQAEVGLIASLSTDFKETLARVEGPMETREVTADELVIRARFGSCGVLVKAECFRTCGVFDEGLRSAEDRDMWIRIARKYRVLRVEKPLWRYRIHGSSMSYNVPKMRENQKQLLRKVFGEYPEFRHRYLLRLKAYSQLNYDTAVSLIHDHGRTGRALWPLALSCLLWPGPFGKRLHGKSFIRLRQMVHCVLGRKTFMSLRAMGQDKAGESG